MWEHAELLHHVVAPEDVGVRRSGLHRRLAGVEGHILRLILVDAVVAVGHAIHVEADDFTAVGDDIGLITDDGGRGADADVFPVADFAGAEFGNDELPEEFAGFFVENHQVAAVADLFGIAGGFIVGADEDLAA